MFLLPMTTEQLRRRMQVYKIELRSHVVLIIWSTMRTADLYNINDVEISYCLPITGTCFIQKIYAPSSSLYFKFIYIHVCLLWVDVSVFSSCTVTMASPFRFIGTVYAHSDFTNRDGLIC